MQKNATTLCGDVLLVDILKSRARSSSVRSFLPNNPRIIGVVSEVFFELLDHLAVFQYAACSSANFSRDFGGRPVIRSTVSVTKSSLP